MTEESQPTVYSKARVATRQGGGGGASEERRRRFQNHLLLFLVVNSGVAAADYIAVAPPGIQWAQWLVMPWLFIFAIHLLGLKSRGFTWVELIVPPRKRVIKEVYTQPLEYEVVRARQLRDGITGSAASIRDQHPEVADAAVAAANELLDAVEKMVKGTLDDGSNAEAEKLVPEAQQALEAFDALHEALIRADVQEGPPESIPIDGVKERAAQIRGLSS